MTNPNLWNQLLVWPILNLLIAFYKLFEGLKFPGPLGFSIIAMTLTIRVILYPLMATQMKSARKMAKLKPHMDELNKKHKNDKQALQQAQMALYKEHGINPAAGCLPLLLQMPILIALYSVFNLVFQNSGGKTVLDMHTLIANINQVLYFPALKLTSLNLSFFGFNLATRPSQWQTAGLWMLAIPLATGLLQWYQTKLMMDGQKSSQPSAISPLPVGTKQPADKNKKQLAESGKLKAEGGKDDKSQEDMAMEMQKQMAIISPIMFGFFAYQFPVGLALYWNIFGIFGIMQQRYINKRYG